MYENVEPHKICTGPGRALLVCDWVSESVLQLVPAGHKYLCTHQLKLDFLPVQGMCYSDRRNMLVFSKVDEHKVFAISFATGEKLWQMNQSDGTIDHIQFMPEDVCSTPQGLICIANKTNLMFLGPSDGDLVSVLQIENIIGRDIADSQARIRGMLGLPAEAELNMELTNAASSTTIVPDSGTQLIPIRQLTDGSPQPNVTVPMTIQETYAPASGAQSYQMDPQQPGMSIDFSQGFHKVMCCESDKGPVLAVRHEEGTIITYKLTSIPDGRVVLEN